MPECNAGNIPDFVFRPYLVHLDLVEIMEELVHCMRYGCFVFIAQDVIMHDVDAGCKDVIRACHLWLLDSGNPCRNDVESTGNKIDNWQDTLC